MTSHCLSSVQGLNTLKDLNESVSSVPMDTDHFSTPDRPAPRIEHTDSERSDKVNAHRLITIGLT